MVKSAVRYGRRSPISITWLISGSNLKQAFHARGMDFLAGRGDDQFLLAAGDEDETLVVDKRDVAGVQPAIAQHFGGGLRDRLSIRKTGKGF